MTGHLHIAFAPLLPMQALEILALVAVLLVGVALYRGARGAAMRGFIFALLLLALANPSAIEEKREPLKDTAVVVIDDSASMSLGDRAAQIAKAAEAITHKLAAFGDLDIETVHVKGPEATDLFHALEPALATIPQDRLAGIIALTDGQVHDTPMGAMTAPFHALIAGKQGEIDRRITVTQSPAYGIVGKSVTLTLRVEDRPGAQSATAPVTFRDGGGAGQTVEVPVGKNFSFDVPVTHAGPNLFAFETQPLPNELTDINNVTAVSVNGIRDRLRVLLVSGEPHIGGRVWRDFLKADPAVDLIHFTILRSPLKESPVPQNQLALIAFPVHELFETKLKSFDLIIFDRFRNQSLVLDNYLENIAKYVEDGGALLISNATDEPMPSLSASPLARVLPAEPDGRLLTGAFVPDLSAAGKRHPVTSTLIDEAPRDKWGPWFRQVGAHAAKGDVLMTGKDGRPLLVLDHAGHGRVAQFLSDQFWLWAKNHKGGGPQAELLRRVAHWLVQEPELDESALHASAALVDGTWQLTIAKRSLHDDSAKVSVFDPEERPVQVTLQASADTKDKGVLSTTVPLKRTGLYHVKDEGNDVLVLAGPTNAPEFGDMEATEDKLAAIAKESGGGISWLADHPDGPEIKRTDANAAQSGWNWIGLRKNGQYRVTGSEAYPLWPAWLALAVLLAVMMLAWRREGRS